MISSLSREFIKLSRKDPEISIFYKSILKYTAELSINMMK